MRRHGLGTAAVRLAAVGLVAVVTSVSVVLLLDRGGLWRGMAWPDTSAVMVLCLCGAAAVTGVVAGRLLGATDHRVAATAVAGLGFLPAAVLAVDAGRNRNDPDVIAMSGGHYVGFAALGVLIGLMVVWIMLAAPATHGPVLVWYGWVAALLAVVVFDAPDRALLWTLAVPAVLAGVLGFAVARSGRTLAAATAAAMSGLLIVASIRWLAAGYWFGWAEQNAPCRVTSGECQSTFLMFELFLIPVTLMIPAAVAAAGAWLGRRFYTHATQRRANGLAASRPSAIGDPQPSQTP